MNIVVIGASGLIGSKLVSLLRTRGHQVVAASPSTGVNTLTAEGLAAALAGAQVVIDVANSPSFEDKAVMDFFRTSGRNLLAAEAAASVGHHIALSVVGADRLPESGYLRAKVAQEELIKASKIPYTILRSTQFFEFIGRLADSATREIRLSPALVQPIASDDVVAALADLAGGPPLNGTVEVAGPGAYPLDKLVRKFLASRGDKRPVVADIHARYFGAELDDRSLTPGEQPRFGRTAFDDWLNGASAHLRDHYGDPPFHPRRPNMIRNLLCAAALAAFAVTAASAQNASDHRAKVTLVYDQPLPNVPGKSIRGVLVEYEPGGSSPAHTHPNSAFIYATILQGAIRSQINDGPVTTYRAGESFSERPGDRHALSANASTTEPARLLAVFVLDTAEKNLTTFTK